MSDDRDGLRAADVDREFVANRLRDALNEGRLTLTEYDDRLGQAYAARTYGDLKGLLADLPTVASPDGSQVVSAPTMPSMVPPPPSVPKGLTGKWIAHEWGDWVTISVILTVIWLIAGAGYFWPIWVIGIMGAAKLVQTVNGVASGTPRRQYERGLRRRAERQERREQREQDRRRERDDS